MLGNKLILMCIANNKNNIRLMRRRSLQPLQTLPAPASTRHKYYLLSTRYETIRHPTLKSINPEHTEIYFNEQKRKSHIRNIIDSYFQKETIQVSPPKTLQPPKNILIRRRTSLITRNRRESLSNTCPQPFVAVGTPEAAELNKSFLSDQQQGLPPIVEATDDPQMARSCFIDMSLSALLEEAKSEERSKYLDNSASFKRKQKLISENQMCRLQYVGFGSSKIPVFLTKEYKEECRQIFFRQQHIWAQLRSMDIKSIWTPNGPLSSQAPPIRNIKSKLMDIVKESMTSEKVYKIITKPYYNELFLNDNHIIKEVLRDLCRQLIAIKGKIINNKINLANLYEDSGKIYISEWGHSALLEPTKGQSGETQMETVTPILKGYKEWFVTPEYLPPQFLEHIAGGPGYDLWENPSSIDMWSVGCMLLELFILVPLWSPLRCHIMSKPGLTRKGIFHSKERILPEIVSKQRKLCSNLKLYLDRHAEVENKANQTVVDLMIRMLHLDPRKRATPEQVLSLLN